MFDYLQQFNALPKEIREKVSSPEAMSALSEMERKYKVDLAMTVMKVMIKSVPVSRLASHLSEDNGLNAQQAQELANDLTARIFSRVSSHLGITGVSAQPAKESDAASLIKAAGLVLPSSDLAVRFEVIISTYLKGIRNKISARDALTKSVAAGGLNLSQEEADRVFKLCAERNVQASPVIPKPLGQLERIVAAAEGKGEYDLKQALASGQTRKIEGSSSPRLDLKHELPAPEKELSLPASEKPKEVPAPVVQAPKNIPIPAPAPIPSSTTAVPRVVVPPTPKPAPVAPSVVAPVKPVNPAVAPAAKAQAPQAAPVAPKPVAAARPMAAPLSNKPTLHDIKPMPKVMGPVEELQFLDLVNFRRLGANPAEITGKIFAKIKLLEQDGYDRMVAGVRAWRQSPVNRSYLKCIQDAMAKGQTLKEYASGRPAQENLSIEEIEAIMAMNSRLVF